MPAGPGRRHVALLRGINVAGHNRVPMPALRELAAGLGLDDVATYIQSGNLVFAATGAPAELEARLERAIAERFGLAVPVIVRPADAWRRLLDANPFPDEARAEPARVMVALARAAPAPGAVDVLVARARAGERVARAGDALWIHYPDGAGRSKLSPGLLDRAAGSPVTTRNWRTALELAARLG